MFSPGYCPRHEVSDDSKDSAKSYRSTNANTLAIWEDNAGIGEIRSEHYYDPVKLAFATGIQPPIPCMVSRLLDELKNVTGTDPLADIQLAHGFHFTFLPRYKVNEPLPENVEQQQKLWHEFHERKIVIRRLLLVALPSQLLLAGIPDEPAIALRQSFCEKLLKTPWRQALLLRHNNSPLR
ncbi:TPA: hypothetical protein K8E22_003969 [Enterobacter cloacae]|nr:hypothetical protein [Enterobacter pasteurii]